ncbi:MAG: hypothetical protein PHR77_08925, partial [Kiritimatiellae bacterium]|nr:hypothetical protein [Kiritimatiellia bacterium]
MFVKIDSEVVKLLCCSSCKGSIDIAENGACCRACGLRFPFVKVDVGHGMSDRVLDFRVFVPLGNNRHGLWNKVQLLYESFHIESMKEDSLQEYLAEIESAREIYKEYTLAGRVLDVGGHQGRLRYFLGGDVNLYISVDP